MRDRRHGESFCLEYVKVSVLNGLSPPVLALTKVSPTRPPARPISKAGAALMAKDDDDGKTVLMLAASTGDPDVVELVASRLPRAQVSR